MYTARKIKFSIILTFAWKSLIFFFLYVLVLCCYSYFSNSTLGFPFVPIGLIGTAVAFYVGFKNNSSYDRLWEARRVWGSIVNASRSWGTFVCTYVKSDDHNITKSQLIHRQIAYVNALRIQLRSKSVWNNEHSVSHMLVRGQQIDDDSYLPATLKGLLTETETACVLSKKNPATHIMKQQAHQLDETFARGYITELFYVQMMGIVQEIYNQQGAAERIKNFPFPRQYAYFSKIFVWLFILILPFGLIGEFSKLGEDFLWLSIPTYVIIAWVFNTMEVVGDTSENPFENAINDIPLTSICRTIEIDLREMLNEENIPQPVKAVNDILM